MSNLKIWIHGLLAAVVGGASTAASAALVDNVTFNFSHAGLVALGKISASAAAISTIAYLKQSPLPAMSSTANNSTK
jgi:hypothetical protein